MAANGQIPASSLSTLSGTNEKVLSALAPQTEALRNAFKAHFGKTLNITDGYRPYSEQERIFRARYTPTYLAGRPYRVWNGVRWYQKPGTAVAAVPGTSNHGLGQAIDFGSGVNTSLTSPEYKWMRANAPAYGWSHPAWAQNAATREPWHWEAAVTPVNYPGKTTGGSVVTPPNVDVPTAPAKKKEPTMRVIQGIGNPEIYSTDGVSLVHLTTQSQVNDMLRVADQQAVVVVGGETINVLKGSNKSLASQVATETWSRSIGNIGGQARTAGQGVALAATDAVNSLATSAETFTGIGPDGKIYLVNIPQGVFTHIPNTETLNALGKRYADPAKRVTLTAQGVTILKAMADKVRKGE